MNKKGFTLIELLAVIVILAIIALIATPIVLNIIEDSKKSAFKQTGNGIVAAAEYYYMKEMSDGAKPTEDKVFTFNGSTTGLEGLEFDGEIPKSGFLEITIDGKIILGITNNKYCITKELEQTDIGVTEYIDGCEFPNYVNGIMSSNDYCILDGVCEAGTLVNVKVNDTKNYNFYVINDSSDELILIMDQNINSDGTPAGVVEVKQDGENMYNLVSWNSVYQGGQYGPTIVMQFLHNATKNWKNIPVLNYTYNENEFQGVTSGYQQFVAKEGVATITSATEPVITTKIGDSENQIRARLPIYSYDNSKTELTNKSIFPFLYDNITSCYWSLSSNWTNSYYAFIARHDGKVDSAAAHFPACGVRPVITLYK